MAFALASSTTSSTLYNPCMICCYSIAIWYVATYVYACNRLPLTMKSVQFVM